MNAESKVSFFIISLWVPVEHDLSQELFAISLVTKSNFRGDHTFCLNPYLITINETKEK